MRRAAANRFFPVRMRRSQKGSTPEFAIPDTAIKYRNHYWRIDFH